jgi:hypothetical protein
MQFPKVQQFRKKVNIEVFITRSLKFRAAIKEVGMAKYEVTVGGQNWDFGIGQDYREAIISKVKWLMLELQKESRRIVYGQSGDQGSGETGIGADEKEEAATGSGPT